MHTVEEQLDRKGDRQVDKRPKILAVDDEQRNLKLVESILLPQGYEVIPALSGKEALQKVNKFEPDVILLDIMMPEMDGFEVARRLKEREATSIIPIVMLTSLQEVQDRVRALEVGADDFLSRPVDHAELRMRIKSLLKVKAHNDHMQNYQKELEAEVDHRTGQLQQAVEQLRLASLDTIYRLSRAADYRDEKTGAHIKRMSFYTAAIARKMGLDNNFVESLFYAAPMHDVGKIGIPDSILLKPGKLNPKEWEIMKRHTTIGAELLKGSDSEFIKLGEVIALTHHEKWDGSGYPSGLKNTQIPLAGRIVALADVFDALTTKRPYRGPLPLEQALDIIKDGRGFHFDPEVVDAFFVAEDEILSIWRSCGRKGSCNPFFS
jgi:putative two-component system response regulator